MARIELIFCLLLRWCILFLHADAAGHHGDVHLGSQIAALLPWKSTLRSSPPALDSWQQVTSPCSSNWTGVACAAMHPLRWPTCPCQMLASTATLVSSTSRRSHSSLIDHTDNSLRGEIPLAITSLPALSYLDLSSNWLHGSILSEFGNMPHLTQLGFAFNNLTGRIPASLRNLTTLVVLAIGKKPTHQANPRGAWEPPQSRNLGPTRQLFKWSDT
jgi:hypothetical protein